MSEWITETTLKRYYPELDQLKRAVFSEDDYADATWTDFVDQATEEIARKIRTNTHIDWEDITNKDDFIPAVVYQFLYSIMSEKLAQNKDDIWWGKSKIWLTRMTDQMNSIRPLAGALVGKPTTGYHLIRY